MSVRQGTRKLWISDGAKEKWEEVVQFARENYCVPALARAIFNLCGRNNWRTVLYTDFAPLSFGWGWFDGAEFRMGGGLIYSGPGQPLDGTGPALTVSLSQPSEKHSWTMHS